MSPPAASTLSPHHGLHHHSTPNITPHTTHFTARPHLDLAQHTYLLLAPLSHPRGQPQSSSNTDTASITSPPTMLTNTQSEKPPRIKNPVIPPNHQRNGGSMPVHPEP